MDTLTIARQLADLHPRARLPCPACGVSVNGNNLAKHLAKVHADFSSLAPGVPGAQLSCSTPPMQDDAPLAWQAPVPQVVPWGT